jgi:signal transduction histidine kinase
MARPVSGLTAGLTAGSSTPPTRLERATQAEIFAVAWEIFSALLFVSAVVPAALAVGWPALIFGSSLAASALAARPLMRRGPQGFAIAALFRAVSWPIAMAPLLETTGWRALVAAFAFGLMAGGMRRAIYQRMRAEVQEVAGVLQDAELLRATLRARLSESAMMAGIAGGHVLLLFSVAFLRTQSQLIFRAWFEIVPVLGVLGTLGFTLAVRPVTGAILDALSAGPRGPREVLARGLTQATRVPDALAYVNFALWLSCTAIGVFYFRTGSRPRAGDAIMQFGLGGLFAWGVSFYQRAWHRDAVAPALNLLRSWTGAEASAEAISLRRRMLRDFGLPLLFTALLSLFSSIGLYRALGADLSLREDFNAITALFASFGMLVIAVGGVVARAARELSRPMTQLAQAADLVAHGKLEATVPRLTGPVEVVGLGESVERMRDRLAGTIAELERERAGLEANVEARTAELRKALRDLKHAQAALVQGERMASIGELVSGVAHEINNPLNAIAGASAPLERVVDEVKTMIDAYRGAERELPPERRRELEALRARLDLDGSLDDLVGISTVVRRATERSVRIVQNLKSFSRVSADPAATDLHAGLEETLMLLGPRLRQACIRVVKEYGELPEIVCRGGEVNQVFMNLLTNAIQALESCQQEDRVIRIDSRVDGEWVIVSIADNGPGVPETIARQIFDPFFTTKPRGQGTGLGLSISSDIARRHGGSLSLERPEGSEGARFVCRLPLAGGERRVSRASLP